MLKCEFCGLYEGSCRVAEMGVLAASSFEFDGQK